MKATRLLIRGIVQGVGFRFFAERAARSLGLIGIARNLRDGRVEVIVAGAPDRVESFIEQVNIGPAGAKVDEVDKLDAELEDATTDFEISY